MYKVDSVSEGKVIRSTRSTRNPRRDSSIAVAAPEHRAPTTMTSNISRPFLARPTYNAQSALSPSRTGPCRHDMQACPAGGPRFAACHARAPSSQFARREADVSTGLGADDGVPPRDVAERIARLSPAQRAALDRVL